jgi:hypothetical protein
MFSALLRVLSGKKQGSSGNSATPERDRFENGARTTLTSW